MFEKNITTKFVISDYLNYLPLEIMIHILSYLSLKDINDGSLALADSEMGKLLSSKRLEILHKNLIEEMEDVIMPLTTLLLSKNKLNIEGALNSINPRFLKLKEVFTFEKRKEAFLEVLSSMDKKGVMTDYETELLKQINKVKEEKGEEGSLDMEILHQALETSKNKLKVLQGPSLIYKKPSKKKTILLSLLWTTSAGLFFSSRTTQAPESSYLLMASVFLGIFTFIPTALLLLAIGMDLYSPCCNRNENNRNIHRFSELQGNFSKYSGNFWNSSKMVDLEEVDDQEIMIGENQAQRVSSV